MVFLELIPSLACPAACRYCFGPHEGEGCMSVETMAAAVEWRAGLREPGEARQGHVQFHGGEPLVAGARFYRETLAYLRRQLGPDDRIYMQTNLWLASDEIVEVLADAKILLSTSLDGPEHLNDPQRGEGNFRRTMAGVNRARRAGISVGCVSVFTAQTAPRADEVFDFFAEEGLPFVIHPAVPSLRESRANPFVIEPHDYGELLVRLLDRLLRDTSAVEAVTLRSMSRNVVMREGSICTFRECLGEFFAVGPDGSIYPCNRFVGVADFVMGNVHDSPALDEIKASAPWRLLAERQERIEEECGGCPHLAYCHGGCPYNALVAGDGTFSAGRRDPECAAYRRFFSHVSKLATAEIFAPANLRPAVGGSDSGDRSLELGPLMGLVRGNDRDAAS
jgi:uncharacterized protein